MQRNPPVTPDDWHWPPLLHGLGRQASQCSQRGPLKPDGHVHEKAPSARWLHLPSFSHGFGEHMSSTSTAKEKREKRNGQNIATEGPNI